jgi:hypothetical protein
VRSETVQKFNSLRFKKTCPGVGFISKKGFSCGFIFALQNQKHSYRGLTVGHQRTTRVKKVSMPDHVLEMDVPNMKACLGATLTIQTSYDYRHGTSRDVLDCRWQRIGQLCELVEEPLLFALRSIDARLLDMAEPAHGVG